MILERSSDLATNTVYRKDDYNNKTSNTINPYKIVAETHVGHKGLRAVVRMIKAKSFKGDDEMVNKDKVREEVRFIKRSVQTSRSSRLGRGNLRLQKGIFYTDDEWKEIKDNHPRLLKELMSDAAS